MMATLFLGGWSGPFLSSQLGAMWFLLKLAFFAILFIWIRATFPRLRIDQIMAFAWKFLLPLSILNILVAGFAYFIPQENIGPKVAVWVVSLGILYAAAKGLNGLNRADVKPREYKYAE